MIKIDFFYQNKENILRIFREAVSKYTVSTENYSISEDIVAGVKVSVKFAELYRSALLDVNTASSLIRKQYW